MISKRISAFILLPLTSMVIGMGLSAITPNMALAANRSAANGQIQRSGKFHQRKVRYIRKRYRFHSPTLQQKQTGQQPQAPVMPAPAPATPVSQPIAAPAPALGNTAASNDIMTMINAINAQRQANGLGAVRDNATLNQAAQAKAEDMLAKNYFAHVNPDGKSDFAFITDTGYRYQAAGSNLAEGDFGSIEGVVQGWMNSPGHKANILADFGQDIGIGIAGKYYVMFITKPL